MSQKIQFIRGDESARLNRVYRVGEPLMDTDSSRMCIGDDVTFGGLVLGNNSLSSESYVIIRPNDGDSRETNGVVLRNAINEAHSRTPYGLPRSETNKFTVIVSPGVYYLDTAIWISGNHLSIIGMTDNPDNQVILYSGSSAGLYIYGPATGFNMSNISSRGFVFLYTQQAPIKDVQFHNSRWTNYAINTFSPESSPTASYCLISQGTYGIEDLSYNKCNNTYLSGTVLSSYGIFTPQDSNSLYNNIRIDDSLFLGLSLTFSPNIPEVNNVIVNNSTFIGENGFNPLDSFDSKLISRFTVNNSKFIGDALFNMYDYAPMTYDSQTRPRYNNCEFIGPSYSPVGEFHNCYFSTKERQSASSTIGLQAVGYGYSLQDYPRFNDCTIISSGTNFCVENYGGESGLFTNCRFNNRMSSTGITGAFGDRNNIIDSKYI